MEKNGLSHFMDLEERTDLLTQAMEDPLNISGPEPFESLQWGKVKHEIPDDIEISQVRLADMSIIEKRVHDISDGDHELTPLLSSYMENPQEPLCINNVSQGEYNEQLATEGKEDDYSALDNSSDTWLSDPEERKKTVKHQCNICKKVLSSKSNLRLHMLKRHEVKMQFSCELCLTKFDLLRELLKHRNSQHRSENGRFTCDKCGRSLVEYNNFVQHLRNHYLDDSEAIDGLEGNVCENCGKNFKDPQGLKMHKILIHNSEGGVLKEKLKQEKNFTCDTCGKRFAYSCLLRDHINTHTGAKPYLCPTCGRSFSQKASLKQHARTHNAVRPHKCPDCPQGFFGKGDLKKHMRKHTGERPYVCEMCGEGFSQSSHLGVHKRTHTGERPFQCDLCGRGFSKKEDVYRHRRIHTGELPYLCQVCGKTFRQSAQCANHIKNHHPDCVVPVARNPKPLETKS